MIIIVKKYDESAKGIVWRIEISRRDFGITIRDFYKEDGWDQIKIDTMLQLIKDTQ